MNIRFVCTALLIVVNASAYNMQAVKDTVYAACPDSKYVRMLATGYYGFQSGAGIVVLSDDQEMKKQTADAARKFGLEISEEEMEQRIQISRKIALPSILIGSCLWELLTDKCVGHFLPAAKYSNHDFSQESRLIRYAPRLSAYAAGFLAGYVYKKGQLKYRDYKATKAAVNVKK